LCGPPAKAGWGGGFGASAAPRLKMDMAWEINASTQSTTEVTKYAKITKCTE